MNRLLQLSDLQVLCAEHKIRWTNHILTRLLQRGIMLADVENAVMHGEIIEQYPDDYPNPSCLILGAATADRKLHVVCGSDGTLLWMITAYYPVVDRWEKDFRKRRINGKEDCE